MIVNCQGQFKSADQFRFNNALMVVEEKRSLFMLLFHVNLHTHTPNVLVALNRYDNFSGNTAIGVTAEHITDLGFNLQIKAWANTAVNNASASWIACA
ncbi:unnamed protein product [Adineta ricciae]|uniref:H-type lectin domain-containing protein n=1 Tax=Adineta ricciae TaxID=249248 RepID=A0A814RM73_ADIRI|nr:unnamed protein product [Adineta ricciae]CAF1430967.1 unnamed protein product [Adineta ricciae]